MSDLNEKRAHYPRVSDIIGKQNERELRNIPLEVLANACVRGQKVHDYCTAWVRNLWITDVEEEYKPYLEAFTDWAKEHIEECHHSSVRLYDDEKRFTGEFDMIVKLRGSDNIVLLDIKTSHSPSKSWPIQLAAYGHLCQINGYKFNSIANLHLKKVDTKLREKKQGKSVTSTFPQCRAILMTHEDIAHYWDIFSSALKCYDYFDRKEVK